MASFVGHHFKDACFYKRPNKNTKNLGIAYCKNHVFVKKKKNMPEFFGLTLKGLIFLFNRDLKVGHCSGNIITPGALPQRHARRQCACIRHHKSSQILTPGRNDITLTPKY